MEPAETYESNEKPLPLTKDIKRREMASTNFLSTYFSRQKESKGKPKGEVKGAFADLRITSGLQQDNLNKEPTNVGNTLKSMVGIKQLVLFDAELDSIKGTCVGNGRMQFRT